MTDGRKYYGPTGMPVMKTYCDKDFTAIKRMRGTGLKVCMLSGDEFINKEMAANRNIDFYAARGKKKTDFIPQFMETYGVLPQNMVYIGDDLFDASIMKIVGHAFCPADACEEIKDICGHRNILTSPGGHNCIAEMVNLLLVRKLIPDTTMEQIEELDKNEKF